MNSTPHDSYMGGVFSSYEVIVCYECVSSLKVIQNGIIIPIKASIFTILRYCFLLYLIWWFVLSRNFTFFGIES